MMCIGLCHSGDFFLSRFSSSDCIHSSPLSSLHTFPHHFSHSNPSSTPSLPADFPLLLNYIPFNKTPFHSPHLPTVVLLLLYHNSAPSSVPLSLVNVLVLFPERNSHWPRRRHSTHPLLPLSLNQQPTTNAPVHFPPFTFEHFHPDILPLTFCIIIFHVHFHFPLFYQTLHLLVTAQDNGR